MQQQQQQQKQKQKQQQQQQPHPMLQTMTTTPRGRGVPIATDATATATAPLSTTTNVTGEKHTTQTTSRRPSSGPPPPPPPPTPMWAHALEDALHDFVREVQQRTTRATTRSTSTTTNAADDDAHLHNHDLANAWFNTQYQCVQQLQQDMQQTLTLQLELSNHHHPNQNHHHRLHANANANEHGVIAKNGTAKSVATTLTSSHDLLTLELHELQRQTIQRLQVLLKSKKQRKQLQQQQLQQQQANRNDISSHHNSSNRHHIIDANDPSKSRFKQQQHLPLSHSPQQSKQQPKREPSQPSLLKQEQQLQQPQTLPLHTHHNHNHYCKTTNNDQSSRTVLAAVSSSSASVSTAAAVSAAASEAAAASSAGTAIFSLSPLLQRHWSVGRPLDTLEEAEYETDRSSPATPHHNPPPPPPTSSSSSYANPSPYNHLLHHRAGSTHHHTTTAKSATDDEDDHSPNHNHYRPLRENATSAAAAAAAAIANDPQCAYTQGDATTADVDDDAPSDEGNGGGEEEISFSSSYKYHYAYPFPSIPNNNNNKNHNDKTNSQFSTTIETESKHPLSSGNDDEEECADFDNEEDESEEEEEDDDDDEEMEEGEEVYDKDEKEDDSALYCATVRISPQRHHTRSLHPSAGYGANTAALQETRGGTDTRPPPFASTAMTTTIIMPNTNRPPTKPVGFVEYNPNDPSSPTLSTDDITMDDSCFNCINSSMYDRYRNDSNHNNDNNNYHHHQQQQQKNIHPIHPHHHHDSEAPTLDHNEYSYTNFKDNHNEQEEEDEEEDEQQNQSMISEETPVLERYRVDVDDESPLGFRVVPNPRGQHHHNNRHHHHQSRNFEQRQPTSGRLLIEALIRSKAVARAAAISTSPSTMTNIAASASAAMAPEFAASATSTTPIGSRQERSFTTTETDLPNNHGGSYKHNNIVDKNSSNHQIYKSYRGKSTTPYKLLKRVPTTPTIDENAPLYGSGDSTSRDDSEDQGNSVQQQHTSPQVPATSTMEIQTTTTTTPSRGSLYSSLSTGRAAVTKSHSPSLLYASTNQTLLEKENIKDHSTHLSSQWTTKKTTMASPAAEAATAFTPTSKEFSSSTAVQQFLAEHRSRGSPSQTLLEVAANNVGDWHEIPRLTPEEYNHASRIVRMQVTLEEIEQSIAALNAALVSQRLQLYDGDPNRLMTSPYTNRRTFASPFTNRGTSASTVVHQFREYQAKQILKRACGFDDRKSKTILSCLCHWRRLRVRSHSLLGGGEGSGFGVAGDESTSVDIATASPGSTVSAGSLSSIRVFEVVSSTTPRKDSLL